MPVRQPTIQVPLALPPEHTERWLGLLERQHGLVTTAQLATFGISRSAITAEVEGGRWQWVLPRVYATFTGPLPPEAKTVAALLYGGPAAVLSHRTAAEHWHMIPVGDGPVHITVPYGTSAISHDGLVVVHRSRAYRHIVVATDPPRTSTADTAVDVAVEEPDARTARRTLIAIMTDAAVRPLEVEERLRDRPPRRYRHALAAAVELVRQGVQSVLEELYAVEVEQAHGIPPGDRQARTVVDGVTLYEDVVYDGIGIPLTVRLDGREHLRRDVAFRDRRRDNAAELAGRSRLVFGWRDLSADPCGGAADVTAVLRRRGWAGETRTCPKCSTGRAR